MGVESLNLLLSVVASGNRFVISLFSVSDLMGRSPERLQAHLFRVVELIMGINPEAEFF